MIQFKLLSLKNWIDAFLFDRRLRGLSEKTVDYYQIQLRAFAAFAQEQNLGQVAEVTAELLNSYLLKLETAGHNRGGRYAAYGAIRAFLNWYEKQARPENWQNPVTSVRLPVVKRGPGDGVKLEDLKAMLATCKKDFAGTRDKAMMLCLLDTGAWVTEFLNVSMADLDLVSGTVVFPKHKGKKQRTVFIGHKTKRAIHAYLRFRPDESPALWVSTDGEKLAHLSLQGIFKRRAKLAFVQPPPPSVRDFRRTYVEFADNGMSVVDQLGL